jgi:hypothetical protein
MEIKVENAHIHTSHSNAQTLEKMAQTALQLARSLGFDQKGQAVSKQQNPCWKEDVSALLNNNPNKVCW